MRIPNGDLMPARRRRYGGGYGRRRRRNQRVVLAVVVIAAAVGGAVYLKPAHNKKPPVQALVPCATPAAPAATSLPAAVKPVKLPAPSSITLSVFNGTNRGLLAKHVADQLATDGFHISTQANAPRAVEGASQVVFGPGASAQAMTVRAWVLGATLVPSPKAPHGSLKLVLGSSYTRLATAAEAAAATATPAPVVTPSPTSSPAACRR